MAETLTCPAHGVAAVCVDSSEVYGRSYGWCWKCPEEGCSYRVGCHKGTREPLGTLADDPTRAARVAAHNALDPIWQSRRMTRAAAYSWLARKLGIEVSRCHVGMMTAEECARVVEVCTERTVERG